MKRAIRITLVDRRGECKCHRGHEIGDSWDFDSERGDICPLAVHSLFPMIDILRYGGSLPASRHGDHRFCCPDADVINIFKVELLPQ